ncbi:hypothetical protein T265_12292 [Opisthorchis viverrini]|uniref:Uncharacterized protein n=1 Tax=Opisthorchis viverrini TaxID=6198 RepID=A0A074YU97_OPIVI|nr:hypothetical protein T265_12292 [Opisthorchis viverrini]KER18371.1 hypothetical protein T265_12292 [Opisthorchis viverrini]
MNEYKSGSPRITICSGGEFYKRTDGHGSQDVRDNSSFKVDRKTKAGVPKERAHKQSRILKERLLLLLSSSLLEDE